MSGDTLPIAHRVWAEPQAPKKKRKRSGKQPKRSIPERKTSKRRSVPEPSYVLIFDTETPIDQFQSLTFGC